MTVDELITTLQRKLRAGVIDEDSEVRARNLLISEDAMEAGSDGYADVTEVLIIPDEAVLLLIDED